MNIPITKMTVGSEEAEAVRKVLESGWLIQGIKVEEFERLFTEYTHTEYAKACTSCTTALHMALLALGIGKGDGVIVPSYTFVASANAIEYTGATPIFADIDINTYNMDPLEVDRRIRNSPPNIKAIMPVHLFGLCADMDMIMVIADEYNLRVIEDAACALGSFCHSGVAGGIGDASCFSMHPRKPITTGEGGMLTTNVEEIAKKVHALRDFGFSVTNLERHKSGALLMPSVEVLGYNYRMTDIQAAIGVEQMKKFNWILEQKIKRAKIYDKELADVAWLYTPHVPLGFNHTYQSYNVLVNSGQLRDKVMLKLKENGVTTRQGTHAIHTLGYYSKKYNLQPDDYPNTMLADRQCMTIPLYPQMTEDEQAYVIEQIKGCSSL